MIKISLAWCIEILAVLYSRWWCRTFAYQFIMAGVEHTHPHVCIARLLFLDFIIEHNESIFDETKPFAHFHQSYRKSMQILFGVSLRYINGLHDTCRTQDGRTFQL